LASGTSQAEIIHLQRLDDTDKKLQTIDGRIGTMNGQIKIIRGDVKLAQIVAGNAIQVKVEEGKKPKATVDSEK